MQTIWRQLCYSCEKGAKTGSDPVKIVDPKTWFQLSCWASLRHNNPYILSDVLLRRPRYSRQWLRCCQRGRRRSSEAEWARLFTQVTQCHLYRETLGSHVPRILDIRRLAAFHYSHAKTQLTCGLIISDRPVEFDTLPFATSTQLVTRLRYANMYPIPFTKTKRFCSFVNFALANCVEWSCEYHL